MNLHNIDDCTTKQYRFSPNKFIHLSGMEYLHCAKETSCHKHQVESVLLWRVGPLPGSCLIVSCGSRSVRSNLNTITTASFPPYLHKPAWLVPRASQNWPRLCFFHAAKSTDLSPSFSFLWANVFGLVLLHSNKTFTCYKKPSFHQNFFVHTSQQFLLSLGIIIKKNLNKRSSACLKGGWGGVLK